MSSSPNKRYTHNVYLTMGIKGTAHMIKSSSSNSSGGSPNKKKKFEFVDVASITGSSPASSPVSSRRGSADASSSSTIADVSRHSSGNSKISLALSHRSEHYDHNSVDAAAAATAAPLAVPFATHLVSSPQQQPCCYAQQYCYSQGQRQQQQPQQEETPATNMFFTAAMSVHHPKHFHEFALGKIQQKLSEAPASGRLYLPAARFSPDSAASAAASLSGGGSSTSCVQRNAYRASLHKLMFELGMQFVPWPSRAMFESAIFPQETAAWTEHFEQQQQQQQQCGGADDDFSVIHVGGLPADATFAEVRAILYLLSAGSIVPASVKIVHNVQSSAHSALCWVRPEQAADICRRLDRRILLDEAGFFVALPQQHHQQQCSDEQQLLLLTTYVDALRHNDHLRYQTRPYTTLTVSVAQPHHQHQQMQRHNRPHHQQQQSNTDEMHHPLCPCCRSSHLTGQQQFNDSASLRFLQEYTTAGAAQMHLDELPPEQQIRVHSSVSTPPPARVAALDSAMHSYFFSTALYAGVGARSCAKFRLTDADAWNHHQFEQQLLQLQRDIRDGRNALNERFPRRQQNNNHHQHM